MFAVNCSSLLPECMRVLWYSPSLKHVAIGFLIETCWPTPWHSPKTVRSVGTIIRDGETFSQKWMKLCQAVCKTWNLVTTLSRAWNTWPCQATCKAWRLERLRENHVQHLDGVHLPRTLHTVSHSGGGFHIGKHHVWPHRWLRRGGMMS